MVLSSQATCHQNNTMKMAKLVGKRCSIKCQLDKKPVEVLWDTEAHVSIISLYYLKKHFPDYRLKGIFNLLNSKDLKLETANGTAIPNEGRVEKKFKLQGKLTKEVIVAFLVTKGKI